MMTGIDVPVPCPISVMVQIVIPPSGAMRTQGEICAGSAEAGDTRPARPTANVNVMPPRPASTVRRSSAGFKSVLRMA